MLSDAASAYAASRPRMRCTSSANFRSSVTRDSSRRSSTRIRIARASTSASARSDAAIRSPSVNRVAPCSASSARDSAAVSSRSRSSIWVVAALFPGGKSRHSRSPRRSAGRTTRSSRHRRMAASSSRVRSHCSRCSTSGVAAT